MHKRLPLTAMLVAGAGFVAAAHAQERGPAGVRIYGIMDSGVEISKSGTGNVSRVFSGGSQGSRLGFVGSEDLGSGLRANFRLEQGITIDDGNLGQGGRVFGREASVGLSSDQLGAVNLGRLPSPYYLVQQGVDATIWEGGGSLNGLARSSNGVSRQVLPSLVNARWDNAVGYISPSISGLTLRAMGALGEGSAVMGRAYGASARYTKDDIDLVLGWNKQLGANNSNGDARAYVAGGSYNFGPLRGFAGYTIEKNTCSTCTGMLARVAGVTGTSASEFRLANLGACVPLGGLFTGVAQATRIMDKSHYAVATGSRSVNWYALGLDYQASRRTLLYASVATLANRNGSAYAIGSGSAQQAATYQGSTGRTNSVDAGIRHNF